MAKCIISKYQNLDVIRGRIEFVKDRKLSLRE